MPKCFSQSWIGEEILTTGSPLISSEFFHLAIKIPCCRFHRPPIQTIIIYSWRMGCLKNCRRGPFNRLCPLFFPLKTLEGFPWKGSLSKYFLQHTSCGYCYAIICSEINIPIPNRYNGFRGAHNVHEIHRPFGRVHIVFYLRITEIC